MKFFGLIATVVALVVGNCEIKENDCSFYERCAEKYYPCGEDGYNLGYGRKYCQSFKDHFPKFSSKGQEWVTLVMKCLQMDYRTKIETGDKMTCPQVRSFNYAIHPKCYTLKGTSICQIPQDWLLLIQIIRSEFLDISFYKQAAAVAKSCGGDFLKLFD
jgi:hypothetical protein